MKYVLRYLQETARLGLVFQRLKIGKPRELQGYVNADYAGDLDQRKSTTVYVFTIAKCIISWKAELQDMAALSTTKTEYMAAIEISKEALRLRGLIETFV